MCGRFNLIHHCTLKALKTLSSKLFLMSLFMDRSSFELKIIHHKMNTESNTEHFLNID